jgi:nondiscriminating aspartyl-tRNA synthetase
MARVLTNQLKDNVGKEVNLQGWLHAVRDLGSVCFVILRDRAGLAQIVLEDRAEVAKLDNLYTGTIVSMVGLVAESPKSKFGYEIQNAKVEVLREIKYPSPVDISKSELKVEQGTLFDERVVTLRHPSQSAIFKVAAIAEKNMRKFFDNNDFTQINSPKIIAFPTEGGSEVFEVQYFDRKVYLAQSPQFYKQIMVGVFERVYEIGRAYRAEKSNTSRHMSEIMMLDAEMGFIDSFEDIISLVEEYIKFVVKNTTEEASQSLKLLGAKDVVLSDKFPRISVKDLHELMKKETGKDYTAERDVSPDEERFICEYSKEHWGSEAIFVLEFPWSDAKFYHHQNRSNPAVTDRGDLLFRGVEVATLTQREVDYGRLIQQIKDKGVDPENPGLASYLDGFKYGMPDEGGFGFGIARFVQKMIGLDNAKEAELFPRDVQRITP